MRIIDTKRLKHLSANALRQLVFALGAILLSLALGMVVVALMGGNPWLAFKSLVLGSFGSVNAISETMVKMAPLLFTGMSYALAIRCGLTNLGMEGQLYMGALASTACGIYVTGLPTFLHLPLTVLAGFVGGGLWGLIAGALKVRFGASEIITTVMLNSIAISFIDFMVNGPMIEPPGINCQTSPVQSTAQLPNLIPGTRVHWGVIMGLLFIFLFWLFLWKTKKGYEVRVSGLNMNAAKYSGINTNRNVLLVMFFAGGLAGLAGANEILGVQIRMIPTISPGYGFDGIAVALIGQNSPIGIIFGALLFAAFRAGGNRMQMMAKVPNSIVSVIQAFIIISVVASKVLLDKWNEKKLKANQRQEVTKVAAGEGGGG